MKKERHFRQRDKPHLLTVEDPQQPGTDIGSGAYNISQVCTYFLLKISSGQLASPEEVAIQRVQRRLQVLL